MLHNQVNFQLRNIYINTKINSWKLYTFPYCAFKHNVQMYIAHADIFHCYYLQRNKCLIQVLVHSISLWTGK